MNLRPRLNSYWVVRLGLLYIAMALSARADGPAKAAESATPLIALSPLEIKAEKIEFQHWHKVVCQHFVLYTDAAEKEAVSLVRKMEMLRAAAQVFLHRPILQEEPIIVVLPTESSDWKKIQSKRGVQWKAATAIIGQAREVLTAEYDWQSDGLQPVWAILGMHTVSAMNVEEPLWFGRGIADFFSTVTFKNDSLTIGEQGPSYIWIKKYGWMDWKNLFTATRDSPVFYKDTTEHTVYEAQCGVLVHYLLTSTDPQSLPHLLEWAAYLEAGNAPEEPEFKRIFKQDWAGMQNNIHHLMTGGSYQTGEIKFPPSALRFSIVSDEPTVKEMRELFVLSRILNQATDESKVSLDALLQHGIKTEQFREVLGDACYYRKSRDAALEVYKEVAAKGSTNANLYSTVAWFSFLKSKPPAVLEGQLDSAVAEEIRSHAQRALQIEPLNYDANRALAWTEALGPSVSESNLKAIIKICRRLDGNGATDDALAVLAVARWRHGDIRQAQSLAERLKQSPFCREEAKKIADEILARAARG